MAKKSGTTGTAENESLSDFDKQNANILWFKNLSAHDIDVAGGKGANLGEMTQNGAPVPPGFVITVSTYRKFLTDSNLEEQIRKLLLDLDVNDSQLLRDRASKIQELIISSPLSEDIQSKIADAYQSMGEGLVAVRSSATAEDLPDASFAGQQSTYLNVDGIPM